MDTVPAHPNRLKELLKYTGMSVIELANETKIALGTLRYWSQGRGTIPKEARVKIAHVIGCKAEDLAPLESEKISQRMAVYLPVLESTDLFTFGKRRTAWMVLDGYGGEGYLPANIRTHYDLQPEPLLPEIAETKEQIEREQSENQALGKPICWNGEQYHLTHFMRSREPANEDMTLDLWFKPSDYYTFLAKDRCIVDPVFRQRYLGDYFWEESFAHIPSTVGIALTLLTSDGYTVLVQRGNEVNLRKNFYTTAVSEGLSRPLDRGVTSQAPDLYRCACRGLAEELGLQVHRDFTLEDIQFFSFGVETRYVQWGIRGMVKVHQVADSVLSLWRNNAKDKMENRHLFAIPFDPKSVCEFVSTHENFVGLVDLYQTLVHEFGCSEVEQYISTFFAEF